MNQLETLQTKFKDAPAAKEIIDETLSILEILLEKNQAYGNSALEPLGCFAKGLSPSTLIKVRIDDKLNRLLQGQDAGEDVILDLIGYLILLRVCEKPKVKTSVPESDLTEILQITNQPTLTKRSEYLDNYPF